MRIVILTAFDGQGCMPDFADLWTNSGYLLHLGKELIFTSITESFAITPVQQCGSGIPQSSGTLEPPAASPLPLFLLHCPATLPNRLLHRGNRLVEDRRAWATREEDEPAGVRCNKIRFDAPQGFPLSLNHIHRAPDPPQ